MILTSQTRDDLGRERPKLVESVYQFVASQLATSGRLPPLLFLDYGHVAEYLDLCPAFGEDAGAIAAGVLGIVYGTRPHAIVQAFEADLHLRRQHGEMYFHLLMNTRPKTNGGQVVLHYECPATIRVWSASLARAADAVRLGSFREIPTDPAQGQGRFTRYFERAAEQAVSN